MSEQSGELNLESMGISKPRTEQGFDQEFSNLSAVAVLVLNPNMDKILLGERKDGTKAVISGKGALDEFPDAPDTAAMREIRWETGVDNVQTVPFYVHTNAFGERIGVYLSVMDEQAAVNNPGGHGRNRGWFDLASTATSTPLAFEHNVYVTAVWNGLHPKNG